MANFWQQLTKPIFILAPMEDVTDTVFRQIVIQAGRPSVFFTEFTSVDGLFSPGVKHVAQRLQFTPEEKPLVAQIWGNNPEKFFKAGKLLKDMGFDGIDINMGCPDKGVIKKKSGGGCIKDPMRAAEIIQATKEGAQGLPVSVKTRLGFKTIETTSWISHLLDQNLAALSIHLRTVAEMSKVSAHWDEMIKIVKLKNEKHVDTVIIGNGDIKSLQEAKEKIQQYRIDGVMIGRGIFENIWIFNGAIDASAQSLDTRINLLLHHMDLFEKTWGNDKHFPILRKYFKIYLHGFPYAQELRMKLMEAVNSQEVKQILDNKRLLGL